MKQMISSFEKIEILKKEIWWKYNQELSDLRLINKMW